MGAEMLQLARSYTWIHESQKDAASPLIGWEPLPRESEPTNATPVALMLTGLPGQTELESGMVQALRLGPNAISAVLLGVRPETSMLPLIGAVGQLFVVEIETGAGPPTNSMSKLNIKGTPPAIEMPMFWMAPASTSVDVTT